MRSLLLSLFGTSLLYLLVALPVQAAVDLPDGSFENFDSTWECDLNCTQTVLDYFIPSASAYDGIVYAYLFHEAGIYQDVAVPADATGLSLWYDNQPDEDIAGTFVVALLDPTTNEVLTDATFDEQSDTWINNSLTIPSSVRGSTVRLYIYNLTGFNRIDYLQFTNLADAIIAADYASITLRVRSSAGKKVKNAKVYVKYGGKRIQLYSNRTGNVSNVLKTNRKGKVPTFTVMRELGGATASLCVKKSRVTECVKVNPLANATTAYEFSFDSKKVK